MEHKISMRSSGLKWGLLILVAAPFLFASILSECIAVATSNLSTLVIQARNANSTDARGSAMRKLEQTVPSTPEDVQVLTREMDGPLAAVAQAAISKAQDPVLIPALVSATESKAKSLIS